MTDVAPPTPPTPKAAAKGLKGKLTGHSKWVYVAMAVGVIGVAYLVHRRNQAAQASQAADPTAAPAPDATVPPDTASYASPGVYAGQTDGAFGGYSTPGVSDNGVIPDSSVAAAPPAIINVYGATPATSDGAVAQADPPTPPGPVAAPTGGGLPNRSVAAHALPPKTVVRPSAAHGGEMGVYHYTDTDPNHPGYERKVFVRRAAAAIKKAAAPKTKKSADNTPAPQHHAASHTKAKKRRW